MCGFVLRSDLSPKQMQYKEKAAFLPSSNVLGQPVSFEAAIEHAFVRTLNSLERLQRMRWGHAVPPPVKVELSR